MMQFFNELTTEFYVEEVISQKRIEPKIKTTKSSNKIKLLTPSTGDTSKSH